MKIFQQRESEVRSYCRSFPAVFEHARGPFIYDDQGKEYIDFFSGAGTLNYGHNNPIMKQAIIEYLQSDGVVHSLDMATTAKRRLLEHFELYILKPRELDYKVQFTNPTGTNTVEAALKLARIVKKRSNLIAFTNGFHGLTSGALSVTGNAFYRNDAFVNRANVTFMPFDGYFGESVNTIEYIRKLIEDESSGVDMPAAVIVETIQSEGGVYIAGAQWLRELEQLCREFDILLIVDDIQVGCGRTGRFFSFEESGIYPDMVALSKSIGGFGLPMSLLLIRPELDLWKPGEHTGTFRGNNLSFVAAAEAIRCYWETNDFTESIDKKSKLLSKMLRGIQQRYTELEMQIRGSGMIYGLEIKAPGFTKTVATEAFQQGVIIETCGSRDSVMKFLPPLIIDDKVLTDGVEVISQSIQKVLRLK